MTDLLGALRWAPRGGRVMRRGTGAGLEIDVMRSRRRAAALICPLLALLWVIWACHGVVRAEGTSSPETQVLRVEPAEIVLRGPDSFQQLAVDGMSVDASPRDVTAEIKLMRYRAPVLDTTGVSPFRPQVRPEW